MCEVPRFDESGAIDDDTIKRLLASDSMCLRESGLVHLDRVKRKRFFVLLRRCSRRYGWRLAGDDIAEAWQETLLSIWKNVNAGEFRFTGRLNAYVGKIFFRRAVDILRRRLPTGVEAAADQRQLRIWKRGDEREFPAETECALVRVWYRKLSKKERLVASHAIRCWSRTNWQKFPAVKQITDSVNRTRNKEPLTANAVGSALRRALKKLKNDKDIKGRLL